LDENVSIHDVQLQYEHLTFRAPLFSPLCASIKPGWSRSYSQKSGARGSSARISHVGQGGFVVPPDAFEPNQATPPTSNARAMSVRSTSPRAMTSDGYRPSHQSTIRLRSGLAQSTEPGSRSASNGSLRVECGRLADDTALSVSAFTADDDVTSATLPPCSSQPNWLIRHEMIPSGISKSGPFLTEGERCRTFSSRRRLLWLRRHGGFDVLFQNRKISLNT
jgi:hypothetical protein